MGRSPRATSFVFPVARVGTHPGVCATEYIGPRQPSIDNQFAVGNERRLIAGKEQDSVTPNPPKERELGVCWKGERVLP